MKANELMIGDFVLAFGVVRVVNLIHERALPGDLDYISTIIPGHEFQHTNLLFRSEYAHPVPLTPEILEKNGFSYPKQSSWMKLDCPERELWGCLHTDGAFWLYASGDCDKDESFAEIRYVHELQHVLKLCGIEKEIVL